MNREEREGEGEYPVKYSPSEIGEEGGKKISLYLEKGIVDVWENLLQEGRGNSILAGEKKGSRNSFEERKGNLFSHYMKGGGKGGGGKGSYPFRPRRPGK